MKKNELIITSSIKCYNITSFYFKVCSFLYLIPSWMDGKSCKSTVCHKCHIWMVFLLHKLIDNYQCYFSKSRSQIPLVKSNIVLKFWSIPIKWSWATAEKLILLTWCIIDYAEYLHMLFTKLLHCDSVEAR